MGTIVFFYFASVIVVTAALVVALRNPVYNALALLVMFFHVAGLFVTLHAEFLAVIQILVYAGAILVLYSLRGDVVEPQARGTAHPTIPGQFLSHHSPYGQKTVLSSYVNLTKSLAMHEFITHLLATFMLPARGRKSAQFDLR